MRKRTRTTGKALFGAMILSLGAAAPVSADSDHREAFGPRVMRFFETFDLDGDGRITREEARRFRDERFTRFDADGDGTLGLEEYEKLWLEAMRRRMVRRFQIHDVDGDGRITREEFARPGEAMFWRLDRDGDGVITRDEVRRGRWMKRRDHDEDDD